MHAPPAAGTPSHLSPASLQWECQPGRHFLHPPTSPLPHCSGRVIWAEPTKLYDFWILTLPASRDFKAFTERITAANWCSFLTGCSQFLIREKSSKWGFHRSCL